MEERPEMQEKELGFRRWRKRCKIFISESESY